MATVDDVHDIARSLPEVTVERTGDKPEGRPIYQVKRKSFVFFRNPRPDAVDPDTGERYTDVICIWVPGPDDKEALVQDESLPFFTTKHFDGYNAVLVRESRLHEIARDELAEIITDAWLTRAPKRLARSFLESRAED